METIQYNAALAITGAIRCSSREKLYQELGLETLQQRRCNYVNYGRKTGTRFGTLS